MKKPPFEPEAVFLRLHKTQKKTGIFLGNTPNPSVIALLPLREFSSPCPPYAMVTMHPSHLVRDLSVLEVNGTY